MCLKKRVGLAGRGKSGGVRRLLAFKVNNNAFFIYGFAKNQQDNVNDKELQMLKLLAAKLLVFDDAALNQAINAMELYEVKNET